MLSPRTSGALPVALPQVPPRASSPGLPAPPLSASSTASSSSADVTAQNSEASTPTAQSTLSRRQAFTYAPLPYSPLQAQLSSPPPSAGGRKSPAFEAGSATMLATVARPLDGQENPAAAIPYQPRQRPALGVISQNQQDHATSHVPTTSAKGKEVVYPTRLAARSVSSPLPRGPVDQFRSVPAESPSLEGFADAGFAVLPAPADSSLSKCDSDGLQRRHWVIERTSGSLELSVEDIPFLARSLLLAHALLDRVEAGLADPALRLPPHEIAREASAAIMAESPQVHEGPLATRKLDRTIGIVTGPIKDPKFPSSRRLQIHALLGPMDAASMWRRKVVYGWLNFYSLEDLVAEMREDTCNNRIRSGYGRAPAPIDRVPFAVAAASPPPVIRQSPPRDLTPRSSTSSTSADRLWDPRMASCISFVSDTPSQLRHGSAAGSVAERLERLDKLIGKIELDKSMNDLEMERLGMSGGRAIDVV